MIGVVVGFFFVCFVIWGIFKTVEDHRIKAERQREFQSINRHKEFISRRLIEMFGDNNQIDYRALESMLFKYMLDNNSMIDIGLSVRAEYVLIMIVKEHYEDRIKITRSAISNIPH